MQCAPGSIAPEIPVLHLEECTPATDNDERGTCCLRTTYCHVLHHSVMVLCFSLTPSINPITISIVAVNIVVTTDEAVVAAEKGMNHTKQQQGQ